MKNRQDGSILVMVTIISAVLITLSMLFLDEMKERFKTVWMLADYSSARYAAEAALEEVKYRINEDANWLASNSSTGDYYVTIDNDTNIISGANISVGVKDNTNNRYSVIAEAVVEQVIYRLAAEIDYAPAPPAGAVFPTGYAIASKDYLMFSYLNTPYMETQDGPKAIVKGNMRTNGMSASYSGNIMFSNGSTTPLGPPPKILYQVDGNVTAAGDIVGNWGAAHEHWSVSGQVREYETEDFPWAFPNLAELAAATDPAYRFTDANDVLAGSITYITLLGDQIQIQSGAFNTTLPLPANGLLYLEDPAQWYWDPVAEEGAWVGGSSIRLKGGTLNGRLTIVSPQTVTIAGGDLKYVDNEGDPAYVINHNGSIVADTDSTVIWNAEHGVTYDPNPNYNPAVPSSFGLIASAVNMNSYLGGEVDRNKEFHGAIWAQQQTFVHQSATSGVSGNFALFGSLAATGALGADWGVGNGWLYASHLYYDSNLDTNPPPFFAPAPGLATITLSAYRQIK